MPESIRWDRILDNFERGRLFSHIIREPGICYSELKKKTGLRNSTLTYHLKRLKQHDYIRSGKAEQARKFYPYNMPVSAQEDAAPVPNDVQIRILRKIARSPGTSTKELKEMTGLSYAGLSYHTSRLMDRELITRKRKGPAYRYFTNGKELPASCI